MDAVAPHHAAPSPVGFAAALGYWFKLGFISFGGPAGQIAMMHQELVERRRWISERRFLHALNYCMLLPGPEAIQLAIYIGWLMHRMRGGIAAGVLFFLPSFFLLVALSYIYMAFHSVPLVAGILYGIKPAVTAIVLFAAWRIGARALRNAALWTLAAVAFVAIFVFDAPFPAIVLAAGIVGYVGGQVAPDKFKTGGGHGAADKDFGPALIDDATPTPAHARFTRRGCATLVAAGVALWLAALGLLAVAYGWRGELTQMGWFFTKAALLTFGGAYAVLPYVYQGGVETYGWLTGLQMIDGLALGETTPGPLIMVVTFVGFVGGWTKQLFGGDALFLAGLAGAAVATFFTFLPSFLFILVGGPLVEATHGDIKFTAPLTGITAAVVGVIINLAVFFAWHVLWPQGTTQAPFAGRFEAFSALLVVGATAALFRFKVGIIPLIGGCAIAGAVVKLLMA
ncbi:MAG: chromate efflux transporter [Rhodocyclaceae bacterium]|nr:chromate efflux transporter [Rhodocyclaceae bacterium]